MDRQTTMNGKQRPARDLVEHLASLTRDLGRIVQLQAQLLAVDLRASRVAAVRTLSAWTMAIILVGAALPVAISGFGVWLADVTQLSTAGGLLCAAVAGVALAVVLALVGWSQFHKQLLIWNESKTELQDNLRAVLQVLVDYSKAETSDS